MGLAHERDLYHNMNNLENRPWFVCTYPHEFGLLDNIFGVLGGRVLRTDDEGARVHVCIDMPDKKQEAGGNQNISQFFHDFKGQGKEKPAHSWITKKP